LDETRNEVMQMLKKTIRPEFLNRIDETIMFLPLKKAEIRKVVEIQIHNIQQMLTDNGVTLQLTDAALDYLAEVGYNPEFGARPVKRAIQRYLLNDLSKTLLGSNIDKARPILVDCKDDRLVFANA
jgi:ATP-dependent Clp protease ATP-binding subunit ClpB